MTALTNLRNKKKLLIFSLIGITAFFSILFITGSIYPKPDGKQVNTNPESKYPFDEKSWTNGKKAGEIILTLEDLEYKFGMMYQNTPENRKDLSKWNKAFESLVADAAIQNEGIYRELVNNSGRIDYRAVNLMKNILQKTNDESVSFEKVTLFFLNSYLEEEGVKPELNLEDRKKSAYEIISRLRNDVAGGLSMTEAADRLKNTPGISKIDLAYRTNAYQKFSGVKKGDRYISPEFMDLIWKMNKDEVSEVQTGKDGKKEYYYTFFRVNEKTQGYEDTGSLVKNFTEKTGISL